MVMHLTVDRDDFLGAIHAAAKAVTKNIPIVKVEFDNDRLWVTGDDQITRITASCVAHVESADNPIGSHVLSVRNLAALVKGVPPGEMSIVTSKEPDVWDVSGSRSEGHISVLDMGFTRADGSVDEVGVVPIEVMEQAITSVTAAASSDPSRPILTGVLLEPVDGHIVWVATDSFRLHMVRSRVPSRLLGENPNSVIVPAVSMQLVAALLVGPVTVRMGTNDVEFDDGTTRVRSRLIVGAYPQYKSLIQKSPDAAAVATIPTMLLVEALKNASGICGESDPVHITFRPDDSTVFIELRNTDQTAYTTTIDAGSVEGAEATVAFNPKYLLRALLSNPDENSVFQVYDRLKPVHIASATDAKVFSSIVMPVRVS